MRHGFSGRLLASVRKSLEHTGLDPEGLELKIVENVLLQTDNLFGRPVPAGEFQDLFLSQEAGAR